MIRMVGPALVGTPCDRVRARFNHSVDRSREVAEVLRADGTPRAFGRAGDVRLEVHRHDRRLLVVLVAKRIGDRH